MQWLHLFLQSFSNLISIEGLLRSKEKVEEDDETRLYLKVLSSLRIFEVGGQNQISAEFVLRQVDRLTGARTRRELMIGAELGSSD
ncbi:hypothetical protein P8452_65830 [Trifolium repens]|nr:hypothetical protein P8452_65830 [Trifolium repens]